MPIDDLLAVRYRVALLEEARLRLTLENAERNARSIREQLVEATAIRERLTRQLLSRQSQTPSDPAASLHSLLASVMDAPPALDVVRSWNTEQCLLAEIWAGAASARASDCSVRAVTMPAFLRDAE